MRFIVLLAAALLAHATVATEGADPAAAAPPDGLAFIGLVGENWRAFVVRAGEVHALEAIESPATLDYDASGQRVAYVGADGILREHDLVRGITRTVFDDARYTQPAYGGEDEWLFLVEMPDGRSRQTYIAAEHRASSVKHRLVRKRGAQFDPHATDGDHLYYSTASCVDDCPSMIWELWRRDLRSGRQVQLTLLNALSRQPHRGIDGRLWFSSDAGDGRFHLWVMDDEIGATPSRMTDGRVRDSEPVADATGRIHFLRTTPAGTRLMRLDPDGAIAIELPEYIRDLRNLRFGT